MDGPEAFIARTRKPDGAERSYLKGNDQMDERTLTALQGSIAKWEKVVNGALEHGPQDCPLCKLFFFDEDECKGCPVAERSGKDACSGTPYMLWIKYVGDHRRASTEYVEIKVFDDKSKQLAQDELDFLKSLLPSSPSAAGGASLSKEK